ncbi:MAG: Hpt domain-containing protein, partial [Sideroxyarcus sp.]|nr:Hpt domain-containing protein [Sideroxyarcus sp.]
EEIDLDSQHAELQLDDEEQLEAEMAYTNSLAELSEELNFTVEEDETNGSGDEELTLDASDLPVAELDEEDELLDLSFEENATPPLMTLEDQVEIVDEDEVAQLVQLYNEHQATGFDYSKATNDDIDIDDPDAQLWDIFGAEALTHLQVVEEFIARMEAEAPIYEPPSEGMQRALHTLKGSAHMAEVTQVAELATPLERFVKELRSYHVNINDDILQLLRDAVSYTQIALHQIETGELVDIPRLQQFIARVNELREIHIVPLVSLQELDESGKRPVDPELLAIFMAEEMNLLLDADKIIAQWAADPADAVQLIPVMDELGKLTQAAAHAYLPAMAELSEKIHSVYETVIAEQLACTPAVCTTLNAAHIALLDMVDAIAAGQNLNGIPDAVNDALD